MNIKDKLRFIDQIQKPKPKSAIPLSSDKSIEKVIDGELFENSFGISFVKTKEYQADFLHGNKYLNQVEGIKSKFLQLAGKDEDLIKIDLKKSIYFDTETTGLAGGSGTYIFLAGLGFFQGEKFILKQFFLRDFPDEPAFLNSIHEIFQKFENLVSFNGKSFDWPLLQTRFISHRIKNKMINPPHLDLLHASRRIWKRRLVDCSLGNIERNILNVQRSGDIPSFLIPQMYFEYLRNKDATPMKQIFYHNEIDILSLVSLAIELHDIHKNPFLKLEHNQDLLTLANYYDTNNQLDRNIEIYSSLFEKEINQAHKKDLGIKLGFCYKRTEQWQKAVNLWLEILNIGNFRIEPYEELAKFYEHRDKNFLNAEKIVVQALDGINLIEQIRNDNLFSEYRSALLYRLERIQNKIKNRIL